MSDRFIRCILDYISRHFGSYPQKNAYGKEQYTRWSFDNDNILDFDLNVFIKKYNTYWTDDPVQDLLSLPVRLVENFGDIGWYIYHMQLETLMFISIYKNSYYLIISGGQRVKCLLRLINFEDHIQENLLNVKATNISLQQMDFFKF